MAVWGANECGHRVRVAVCEGRRLTRACARRWQLRAAQRASDDRQAAHDRAVDEWRARDAQAADERRALRARVAAAEAQSLAAQRRSAEAERERRGAEARVAAAEVEAAQAVRRALEMEQALGELTDKVARLQMAAWAQVLPFLPFSLFPSRAFLNSNSPKVFRCLLLRISADFQMSNTMNFSRWNGKHMYIL